MNHKKPLGLYRAKETRFAGKYREMGRALRLKCDLQQVVVSSEYAAKKFGSISSGGNDDAEDTGVGVDNVKAIIPDESYWNNVVSILKVAVPVIKVLRLSDNTDKEALGKVYDRMCKIGNFLDEYDVPWASEAAEIHSERWEYLHGRMHAAAYALDPEFLDAEGELDEPCQEGLLEVVERYSLRSLIMSAPDPDAALLLRMRCT